MAAASLVSTVTGPFRSLAALFRPKSNKFSYDPLELDPLHPSDDVDREDTNPPWAANVTVPRTYELSPLQSWLTALIHAVAKADYLGLQDLPAFSHNANYLRAFAGPLRQARSLSFLFQWEIGSRLFLGGVLEFLSSACVLASPVLLRLVLSTESPPYILIFLLFIVTLLATIFGRAKDQVCRVQSARISAMLQTAVFEKSLNLSVKARLEYPAGKIMNISTNDVKFLENYFLKVHDIWSAPAQLVVIFVLVLKMMGVSGVFGFAAMLLLFVSQSRANTSTRSAISSYITLNDSRLKYLREVLYSIKGIKLLALESRFSKLIASVRAEQLKALGELIRLNFCYFTAINQMTSGMTAAATFAAYYFLHLGAGDRALSADVVFPALTLINLMYQPASKLSIAVTRQFSVWPCAKRVVGLLTAAEDKPSSSSSSSSKRAQHRIQETGREPAIVFRNALFQYAEMDDEDGREEYFRGASFLLGPLDLRIPHGKLTVVVGPVASGKSTLLNSIIGQTISIRANSMSIHPAQSLALCAQNPWVLSGTVRENIVFLSTYNEARYRKTVQMCCLEEDIVRWPGGHNAVIGEKGTNLSGGQQARIALARAVYSEADVILLDDCLAAVDAHVGKHLFHECIRKLTQTVILVTHQVDYVPYADYVVALDQGRVVEHGPTAELLGDERQGHIKRMMPAVSATANPNKTDISPEEKKGVEGEDRTSESEDAEEDTKGPSLVEEEERSSGSVERAVYRFYATFAGGTKFLVFVAIMFVLCTIIRAMTNYWFVWWIDDRLHLDQVHYTEGYLGWIILQAALVALLGFVLVYGSLRASQTIHEKSLSNIFSAPLWYFETQPMGRIINRFSADIQAIDVDLMNAVDGLFVAAGSLTASTLIIIMTAPYLVLIVAPLTYVSYRLQGLYRIVARELRRVISISKSPVVACISETLSGIVTIKAYNAEQYFLSRHSAFLDKSNSASVVKGSLDTWITFRVELLSALLLLGGGLLTASGVLPQAQAGLALSTAITFTTNVYLLLWALITLEVEMNSVERLRHYVEQMPREDDSLDEYSTRRRQLRESWPETGHIQFKDLTVKYRTTPQPAIDMFSLDIPSGKRIGIVGRTGSGKSTLISTLSRLVDATSGTITLSGVDIMAVPLPRLRFAVAVLPQEPLLFEGTLRENLDCFGHFRGQDSVLLSALEKCGLTVDSTNGPEGDTAVTPGPNQDGEAAQTPSPSPSPGPATTTLQLDSPIDTQGANLSAGQKALICIARTMLLKPKALLIDEATAAIDFKTDKTVQMALRTQFCDTTILCVAHRVRTMAWMDEVLVMEGGKMVERGAPVELLGLEGGLFRGLVEEGGQTAVDEMINEVGQVERVGDWTSPVSE